VFLPKSDFLHRHEADLFLLCQGRFTFMEFPPPGDTLDVAGLVCQFSARGWPVALDNVVSHPGKSPLGF